MGGSSVVLVVEDEWFLRECIAAHLRTARWRILEARTGGAALSLLEEREPIDVVIYPSGTAVALDRAVAKSRFIPKPYEPDAIVDACRTSLRDGGCQC